MKIAVLHPGAMGTSVAQALLAGGSEVFWVSKGRSDASRRRALELNELADVDELGAIDAVVSVCPPESALSLAKSVVEAGFGGLYVDANAVSPDTARAIGDVVLGGGGRFVDGGIIGPPAHKKGTTRLYLSGVDAGVAAAWFEGSVLEAVSIEGGACAASALKMCYAAYTKGTSALVLAIRALAEAEGVAANLISEWNRSQPGLVERSEFIAAGTAPKAWRFVGEMEEIASGFEAAGLPGEFHHGAARLYQALAEFKDQPGVTLEDVVKSLLA